MEKYYVWWENVAIDGSIWYQTCVFVTQGPKTLSESGERGSILSESSSTKLFIATCIAVSTSIP